MKTVRNDWNMLSNYLTLTRKFMFATIANVTLIMAKRNIKLTKSFYAFPTILTSCPIS